MFFPDSDLRMEQILHKIIIQIHLKVWFLKCMTEIRLHHKVPLLVAKQMATVWHVPKKPYTIFT